jgi:heme oxygenase (mycobilin-producing)
MILVMNRFSVTPGREQDFEQAFRDRAKLIDQMPGFLGLDMLRPASPGGVFISMTRWARMEDFEGWTKSEAFRKAHGKRHEGMFTGHPVLEIFEVFDSTMEV